MYCPNESLTDWNGKGLRAIARGWEEVKLAGHDRLYLTQSAVSAAPFLCGRSCGLTTFTNVPFLVRAFPLVNRKITRLLYLDSSMHLTPENPSSRERLERRGQTGTGSQCQFC